MIEINSVNNDRIKAVRKLAADAKTRVQENSFIVEGLRMVRELPVKQLKELYLTQRFLDSCEDERIRTLIDEASAKDSCFLLSEAAFKKLSSTESPQGVLAVADIPSYELSELTATENPFILVLDKLQDPGNAGTIIRTAEGAGVSGILISSDSVDVYSPKVVRSTMGAIFRVKIVSADSLPEALEKLQERKVVVYGTHLDGEDFYDCDLTGPVAILIGNEGNGLRPEVSSKADRLLRIPMNGELESLNAGVSAAVVMYEGLRQRMVKSKKGGMIE